MAAKDDPFTVIAAEVFGHITGQPAAERLKRGECPFCGKRFPPDDGGCGCRDEEEYWLEKEVEDTDDDDLNDDSPLGRLVAITDAIAEKVEQINMVGYANELLTNIARKG